MRNSTTPTVVRATSSCRSSTRPSASWRRPRTSVSSTAMRPPASWVSPSAARIRPSSSERTWSNTPRWWPKPPTCSARPGIAGPYGLAIGPEIYTGIVETDEHGGHLLLDHLRQILGGPLVWAPGVQGGVVLSLRGGDFVLDCGQDLSIGYLAHDAQTVRLYVEESFSFRVLEPDASSRLAARGLTGPVHRSRKKPGARRPGRRAWTSRTRPPSPTSPRCQPIGMGARLGCGVLGDAAVDRQVRRRRRPTGWCARSSARTTTCGIQRTSRAARCAPTSYHRSSPRRRRWTRAIPTRRPATSPRPGAPGSTSSPSTGGPTTPATQGGTTSRLTQP